MKSLVVLAMLLQACPRASTRIGTTTAITELAALNARSDGSILLLGAYEPATDKLFGSRARIVGIKDGNATVLHDGEGSVIDASWPSERVAYALVRRLRPATPDVVRDYWLVTSRDGGDTWQRLAIPEQDSMAYVEFADAQRGWLLGYRGAFTTSDSGASWSPVTNPPRAELEKNLLSYGNADGALTFSERRLDLRDAQLVPLRSHVFDERTHVQCFAKIDAGRLLAITATEVSGRHKRAEAWEIGVPSFETIRRLDGLPDDFVCDHASGGSGAAAVSGARLKSASFFGISHDAFRFSAGDQGVRPFRLRREREAILAPDGQAVLVGQVDWTRHGLRAEVYRSR